MTSQQQFTTQVLICVYIHIVSAWLPYSYIVALRKSKYVNETSAYLENAISHLFVYQFHPSPVPKTNILYLER